MHRTLLTTTSALALLLLAACQSTPPPNRGQSGYRVDPAHDAPGELGSRTPRSADLLEATDQMAQDLASRLDVVNPDSQPRIYLADVRNHSRMPHQNYQAFLVRLRGLLQQSSARHGMEFIRERAVMEHERTREYGGKDPESTAAAYQSRADYALMLDIYDLPSGATNYYLFNYQLVQLRDAATGPDTGAGAIVWENQYEVKFQ